MDYSIFGTVLYALSAAAYALLLILLLASKNSNTTRTVLLAACTGTIASDIAIAAGFSSILGVDGAFLELAIAGMWGVFALHHLLGCGMWYIPLRAGGDFWLRCNKANWWCGNVICYWRPCLAAWSFGLRSP